MSETSESEKSPEGEIPETIEIPTELFAEFVANWNQLVEDIPRAMQVVSQGVVGLVAKVHPTIEALSEYLPELPDISEDTSEESEEENNDHE